MTSIMLDVTRVKNLYSGLGQHALHLGSAILELNCEDLEPQLYLLLGDEVNFPEQHQNVCHAKFWHKEEFRKFLNRVPCTSDRSRNLGIWHTFDQLSSYGPGDSQVPVILTVHDLNFPDRSQKSTARGLRTVQRRVDRASVIVTSSEYSAMQIRRQLSLGSKQVRVIKLGHCLDQSIIPQRPSHSLQEPFLFSIGEFRSTKNFHTLVTLMEQLPDYQLVIAGNLQSPYGQNVLGLVKDSSARSRIHLPGKVSDPERRWLYENCEAFLFPSTAEGFGLPVIETMSCGRPVFTTQAMCLPEVAGPLAFYWEDLNPKSMVETFRNGMRQFHDDSDYSDKLKTYAAQFDWKTTAQSYVQLYREIL